MGKFLISLLVASALTPAAAVAQDRSFGRGDRSQGERSSQRDSSSDSHVQRAERATHSERAEPTFRVGRAEGSGGAERAVRMDRAEPPVRVERNVEQVKSIEPVQRVQPVRRVDRGDDGFVGAIRPVEREAEGQPQGQVDVHRGDGDGFSGLHDRIVRDGDRDGDRDGSHHRWNGDWRHDHRYDWRSHRSRYSSLYHYGRYYDPYGWGYRRFSIGFNLWPSYYGSNYWMNDPWQYRLPPAYGPYRWVRYYDDVVLVNIYTGEVVDVVNNFFW